ncbi:extracellular solute-binding protein [Cohnella sp. WQ 127256]|uniref:extracellular solute-binding protein n=1 Tax=Cohnella sp. WQ 127256 TaxID=2938790 RepID=UPI002117356F|nr:extracellular solute-binding protein [Cohnella sp. WQ 127256]
MNKFRALSVILASAVLLSACSKEKNVEPGQSSQGSTAPSNEQITLKLAILKTGQVEDYNLNSYTKYLEEKTGYKLEIETYAKEEANQKLELLIASGTKLPDAFIGNDFFGQQNKEAAVYRHAENGYFIPLDELIEKYGTNLKGMAAKANNKDLLNMMKSPDGKTYALPSYDEQTSNEYSLRAYINKKWLDALKLDMPTTTQELENVLKAFKTGDPNGNKKADEIGVMGGGNWHQYAADYLLNSFIYTDGENRWNITNGKLDVPYNKEEWRDGLKYLNQLKQEGLFDPLSFTQDGNSFKSIATAGDTNSIGVLVTAGMGQLFAPTMSDRKGEYVPLNPLKGPNGASFAARYPINPAPALVITKDSKHPEEMFRLADFMMSEESSVFSRFGQPEVDWIKPPQGSVALGEEWGATPEIKPILIWGGSSHSSHWNNVAPHILLQKYTDGQAWNGDATDAEYMIAMAIPGLLGKEPKEVATLILYDKEQSDAIADIKIALTTYVKESLARFVTGDLNLDKDWDSYLNGLNKIGLEKYIEVSQAAYDRMLGK